MFRTAAIFSPARFKVPFPQVLRQRSSEHLFMRQDSRRLAGKDAAQHGDVLACFTLSNLANLPVYAAVEFAP